MESIDIIKERISNYNTEYIDNLDLLRVILGEKIINKLIKNNYNNFKDIMEATKDDLKIINGIGPEIINKIIAIGEIAKRQVSYEVENKIGKPEDVYNICLDMINFEQEVGRIICLNTKNLVLAKIDLFKGGLNSATVDPRIIFKEAIKRNSANIIFSHNHPSGDPTQSKEDVDLTYRIKECGKILGIELLDHIIIGYNKYTSLKEKGLMWSFNYKTMKTMGDYTLVYEIIPGQKHFKFICNDGEILKLE